MRRLLVSLILITGALGQITRNGTCNFTNILAVRDLNLTRLSGDWHQIRRIPNTEECGSCSSTTISAKISNSTISNITISNREVKNGKAKYRNGSITLSSGRNDGIQGQFTLKYGDNAYDSIFLATNYTDYAVLYSCKNVNNVTKNVWAWVYSRNVTLGKREEYAIQSVIDVQEDLKNAEWINSDHSKKACQLNSGTVFGLSTVFTALTFIITAKGFIATEL
ncbi:apolipoprotein D-like [Battus philenor]|uniref:apolipoprotein D-like n=1 Tax=Battus philenor TaxID=42288 RepID=UPI0035CEDA3D